MYRDSQYGAESAAPPRLVEMLDGLVRPRGAGGLLLSLAIIAALLAGVLLTPPISVAERVAEFGFQHVGKEGVTIRQPDGTQLVIGRDMLPSSVPMKMNIVPLADFLARPPAGLKDAVVVPPRLTLKSAVYTFDTRGHQVPNARLSMLIPTAVRDEELNALDIYTWDGTSWQWQPTTVLVDEDEIYTTFMTLPKAAALFAVSAPRASVGAMLTGGGKLADECADVLGEVTVAGLWVDADGSIKGTLHEMAQTRGARYLILPTVQNLAGDKWDGDLVANIIQNSNLRKAHITNLVALADRGPYAGVNLDYRRLPATAEDRDNFTAFIQSLANELHARRKVLMLTLEAPTRVSDDPRPEFAWNTGGYDWAALGRAADAVRVLVPAESGDQLITLLRTLSFATTQMNRQKLQPVLVATSTAVSSKGVQSIGYDDALTMATTIEAVNLPQPVVAGESTVTVRHAYLTIGDSKTPFVWDAQARQYRFAFRDGDGVGTVWLQNAASIACKVDASSVFAVKGVALWDPTTERMDPEVWEVLRSYAGTGRAPLTDPSGDNLRATWKASGGDVLPGANLAEVAWKAPPQPGNYTVQAALPPGLGGKTGPAISINVTAPTPAPAPTAAPGRAAGTPTPIKVAVATTEKPKPLGTMYVSADGDGVYIRSQPDREAKVKVWPDGTAVTVLEELAGWYKVEAPDGYVGYIPSQWLAKTPPPTPTPRPAPRAIAASPAVGKYGFDYGIQAAVKDQDYNAVLNAVAGLGFRWIKQQVRWQELEPSKGNYQLAGLDGAVNAMSSRGFKILLSVMSSPAWANPAQLGPPKNYNDYGDFVAELARRYKGKVQAYEIWNEQNIAYEWKGETINANRYMELLRIAYQRIKAIDPDAVIVAGALTPTGVNDPSIAVDDRLYLRQMYEAGLKGVSDAIGAHPSGFACPPDARWPDAIANVPSHNNHPSFYFRNTMEDYRNIMIEYGDSAKQIWPTEFGWCSASKPVPSYEYCAYNTEQARAQYIVRAYQMAKAWGFVGPMFLWNLNWRVFEPHGEQAQFGILDPGYRPTPAYIALRDMPK